MQDPFARLRELLAPYPAPLDAAEKMLGHVNLVLKWGKSMNLTGATKAKELIEEHVADALPLAFLFSSGASVLDVGAGAGFPGVIIAIARPDVTVSMLETNHKKAVFLRNALREANRNGFAFDGDVFHPPPEMPSVFDAVVSRAVFAPEKWVEIGSSFVKEGGSLYALLAGTEVPQAPASLPNIQTCEYRLLSGAKRSIAVYRASE